MNHENRCKLQMPCVCHANSAARGRSTSGHFCQTMIPALPAVIRTTWTNVAYPQCQLSKHAFGGVTDSYLIYNFSWQASEASIVLLPGTLTGGANQPDSAM